MASTSYITDFHAHVPATPGAVEAFLQVMDQNQIARACVVAGGTVSKETLAQGILEPKENELIIDNLSLLQRCLPHIHRLLPFFFSSPHRGAGIYAELGSQFYGLKIGPAVHGVKLTDPRYIPFLEEALRFLHPVYLHCLAFPGYDVRALLQIAQDFPHLNFILGHAGIGQCDFASVSVIRDQANIFLETSGGFTSLVKYACEVLGSRRVLFGSEYPLQRPEVELSKVFHSDLSSENLADVFQKTAEHLLSGVA